MIATHNTMTQTASSTLIIDDHQLFADGLELLLTQLPDANPVDKFNDAQQVLENPAVWQNANLIIIDLHMPGLNGFAFLQAMQDRDGHPPIAVISGAESRAEIDRALGLGAMGFIPKDCSAEEMLTGVNTVLKGGRYLPPQWVGKVDWPVQDQALNKPRYHSDGETIGPRQIEVLKLLQQGLRNKQIALVLGVSVSTVKSHTQLIYRCLHVGNRTAAIRAATELGLL